MNKLSPYFLVLCLFLGCSDKETIVYDLIITNVNLIDGTGSDLQQGVNIYVKDSKISKIDSVKVGQAGQIIDGTGKYVIPGLFDCHVHTEYKVDFPKFTHFGVTSIFVTGGGSCTNEYFAEMRALGNQDSIPAPRVFHTSQHFTMEGRHPVKTYGSSRWVEGKTVYFLRDTLQIENLVKEVASQPILGIKLTVEDGPHPPMVERMPQAYINKVQVEADKNGIEVYAHVSDNIELEMVLNANIKNLVHFTGVELDFEHDSSLLSKIYANNINWVTTLMLDKSFQYPLNPEWTQTAAVNGVFDSTDYSGMDHPGYLFRAHDYINYMKDYLGIDNLTLQQSVEFQVEDILTLSANGVNMVLGTDTGNAFILPGYALHEEMQLLELGGMTPLEIIKMGTLNAAKMMKADKELGSIEVGKLADMVVLEKNPLTSISNSLSIETVIKNGAIQTRIVN
ncbi:MAG: amidohydrolase family protein [Reichenbachiella sp.]|uniref:amidohydrolase family protein n=1 Tax=Reichenbachiella sp. TaxID=2184521 RepID=UPI0032980D90